MKSEQKRRIVIDMISAVGEDSNRYGVQKTPDRVVRSWKEVFRGYDENNKPVLTAFPNDGTDGLIYDGVVSDAGPYYSCCEHHMLPFFGQYFISYIPGESFIGLSKIGQLVDFHAARMQIQERLECEVLDDLDTCLKPRGIGIVLVGRHLCREMRGAKKSPSPMTTCVVRGSYEGSRQDFINHALLSLRHARAEI